MTVVITGTTRGFGAVMAQELMLRGYNVLCTGRGPNARSVYKEMVEDAQRELAFRRESFKEKTGFEEDVVVDMPEELSHGFWELDLMEDGQIKDLCGYIRANLEGAPLFLINNAAVSRKGWTDENVRTCMDTNFWGPVKLTEGLLPIMGEGSRIFNVLCSNATPKVGGILPMGVAEDLYSLSRSRADIERFLSEVRKSWDAAFPSKQLEGIEHGPYAVSKALFYIYTMLRADELRLTKKIYLNGFCPGLMDTNVNPYPETGRNPFYTSLLLCDYLNFDSLPNASARAYYHYQKDYPFGRFLTSSSMAPLETCIDPMTPSSGSKDHYTSAIYSNDRQEDWRIKFIRERKRKSGVWGSLVGMFS